MLTGVGVLSAVTPGCLKNTWQPDFAAEPNLFISIIASENVPLLGVGSAKRNLILFQSLFLVNTSLKIASLILTY